jgi:hypothetical protein
MTTPADLYRPSPRRSWRVIIGGSLDGAVPCVVSRQGTASYRGKRVYQQLLLARCAHCPRTVLRTGHCKIRRLAGETGWGVQDSDL